MVVAMMRRTLVWLSTTCGGHAYALDLGSEVVGQSAAPKHAIDPREGNTFMAVAKHMDCVLDLRAMDMAVLV